MLLKKTIGNQHLSSFRKVGMNWKVCKMKEKSLEIHFYPRPPLPLLAILDTSTNVSCTFSGRHRIHSLSRPQAEEMYRNPYSAPLHRNFRTGQNISPQFLTHKETIPAKGSLGPKEISQHSLKPVAEPWNESGGLFQESPVHRLQNVVWPFSGRMMTSL